MKILKFFNECMVEQKCRATFRRFILGKKTGVSPNISMTGRQNKHQQQEKKDEGTDVNYLGPRPSYPNFFQTRKLSLKTIKAKLFLSTILAIIIFIPLSHAIYKVPEAINFAQAFEYLHDRGALDQQINDYPLNDLITRTEYLKILFRGLDLELNENIKNYCLDTPINSDDNKYFEKAIELGVVLKNAENNCFPDKPVQKIFALHSAFQIAGIPLPKIPSKANLPKDVKSNSRYRALIQRALETNLAILDKKENFSPFKSINKKETIELIYKTALYINPDLLHDVEINGITLTNSPNSIEKIDIIANNEIENIDVLIAALNKLIETYYFKDKDKLNKDNIVYVTLNALVEKLSDPYTSFQDPSSKTIQISLGEDFEGIGIEISRENNQFVIKNVLKNSPAEKSGLLKNDILIKVDEKNLNDITTDDDLVNMIRGPKGTEVKISIQRGAQNLDIPVIRDTIALTQVEYKMLKDNIAYFTLKGFSLDADKEFNEMLEQAKSEGMKRLIIDVRGNIGGYLHVTLNILGHFIKKDMPITYVKLYDGREIAQNSMGTADLANIPLVVLTDKDSASASEIFASAIKYYKAGTLIGERTFGKTTVQELAEYNNESILKITVGEWTTPDKKPINKVGINPNIIIKQNNPTIDKVLQKAIKMLRN